MRGSDLVSDAATSHQCTLTQIEQKTTILQQTLIEVLLIAQTTHQSLPTDAGYPWARETPVWFQDAFGKIHPLPFDLCRDQESFAGLLRLLLHRSKGMEMSHWDFEVVNDSNKKLLLICDGLSELRTLDEYLGSSWKFHIEAIRGMNCKENSQVSMDWAGRVYPGAKLGMNMTFTVYQLASQGELLSQAPLFRHCLNCGELNDYTSKRRW